MTTAPPPAAHINPRDWHNMPWPAKQRIRARYSTTYTLLPDGGLYDDTCACGRPKQPGKGYCERCTNLNGMNHRPAAGRTEKRAMRVEKIRQLARLGYSDSEIAVRLHVTARTVCRDRIEYNIPSLLSPGSGRSTGIGAPLPHGRKGRAA